MCPLLRGDIFCRFSKWGLPLSTLLFILGFFLSFIYVNTLFLFPLIIKVFNGKPYWFRSYFLLISSVSNRGPYCFCKVSFDILFFFFLFFVIQNFSKTKFSKTFQRIITKVLQIEFSIQNYAWVSFHVWRHFHSSTSINFLFFKSNFVQQIPSLEKEFVAGVEMPLML